MILAAEYIPSPLQLMLVTHWQEIGFSGDSPRFPSFFGGELGGKRGIPVSRFGRERESGSRGGGPGISWSASGSGSAAELSRLGTKSYLNHGECDFSNPARGHTDLPE
jgi:hypothetical protein